MLSEDVTTPNPDTVAQIPNLISVLGSEGNIKSSQKWYKLLDASAQQTILNIYTRLLKNEDNYAVVENIFTQDQLAYFFSQREIQDFKFTSLNDFELLNQVMISLDDLAPFSVQLYIFLQQQNLVDPSVFRDWFREHIFEPQRQTIASYYLTMLNDENKFGQMMLMTPEELKPLLLKQRGEKQFNPESSEDFTLINLMIINLNVSPHLGISLFSYSQSQLVAQEVEDNVTKKHAQSAPQLNTPRKSWSISKFLLAIVALTAALIFLPISTFAYSIAKLSKATTNLYNRHKVTRSLWRFAGFYLGAGGGVAIGLATGAVIGSIIPGLGTLAGSIIGAICFSSIGSALGIFVAKELSRIMSWCAVKMGFYGSERIINPTNPKKYLLTAEEKKLHAEGGVTDTIRIYNMLAAIKIELSKIKRMAPGTEQQEAKKEYLQLLKAVKTRPSIARNGFFQQGNNWFKWNENGWINGAKPSVASSIESLQTQNTLKAR